MSPQSTLPRRQVLAGALALPAAAAIAAPGFAALLPALPAEWEGLAASLEWLAPNGRAVTWAAYRAGLPREDLSGVICGRAPERNVSLTFGDWRGQGSYWLVDGNGVNRREGRA